jgi:hypothetical protein
MEKVMFNLVFNTINLDTYTGTAGNPTFYTSLNTLVPQDKYNKFYKVSFRFKSPADPNIGDQENYRIEMIINSRVYTQQNNQTDYTLGVLSKTIEDYTTNLLSFDTKPFDNPPVIIQSLDRIDRITFKIIEESTQTPVVYMPDYVLIVHFEEM